MGPLRGSVFAASSVPASLVWAAVVALFGLRLTALLHGLAGHLRAHEHGLILAAVAFALSVAVARQWRSRR